MMPKKISGSIVTEGLQDGTFLNSVKVQLAPYVQTAPDDILKSIEERMRGR